MVSKQKIINVGHLYPEHMNVYGDMGNVLAIVYRLESRGYIVKYQPINQLNEFVESDVDILIGGGGQDSNQLLIESDLKKYSKELKGACDDGMVNLMICGMYQLFGNYFLTANGKKIQGAGIFNLYTEASTQRMIGNVKAKSQYGYLVGFENHSGKTFLLDETRPLATVYQGGGNNGEDKTEGAMHLNSFGTYLHGPVLPNNPVLADEIISRAVERKFGHKDLQPLDDKLEQQTSEHIRRLSY